ncbi:hypothetical protein QE152_g35786 [Popillia japonica]|uniref:Uncharacterized protein n=1 Tax=Popillia japonica TaxID=7064 RepID=A0AAW1IF42_POPJA
MAQNDKNVIENVEDRNSKSVFKSPEEFRGFPKAAARKSKITRRKGKSIIATDTAENDAIEERAMAKDSESSEEEPILDSSSGDECFDTIDPHRFAELARSPMKDDFVLVEFTGKTEKKIYFLGKVLSKIGSNQEYEIAFLRNQEKGTSRFVFPDVADEAVVPKTDIKLIMPPSIPCGHTSRQKAPYTF